MDVREVRRKFQDVQGQLVPGAENESSISQNFLHNNHELPLSIFGIYSYTPSIDCNFLDDK